MQPEIKPGYQFESAYCYSKTQLQQMALQCGDSGPIHHDSEVARHSRFGRVIASGSAVSAQFSALIPSHFASISPLPGLEMSFKFMAPAYAEVNINMRWKVVEVTSTSSGRLVNLKGDITDDAQSPLVSGTANVLLVEPW